jgi:putative ABC transport system substrate-binding protein
MTRRTIALLVTFGLAILVAPLAAAPLSTKVYRIGVLFPGSAPSDPDWQQQVPF